MICMRCKTVKTCVKVKNLFPAAFSVILCGGAFPSEPHLFHRCPPLPKSDHRATVPPPHNHSGMIVRLWTEMFCIIFHTKTFCSTANRAALYHFSNKYAASGCTRRCFVSFFIQKRFVRSRTKLFCIIFRTKTPL